VSLSASAIAIPSEPDLRADSRRLSFQNIAPPPANFVAAGQALLHTGAQAAPDDCPPGTAHALQQARTSLESDDPAHDRAALACLVEAVASLNSKLTQLITGDIPSERQPEKATWLAMGWFITRPHRRPHEKRPPA